MRFLNPIRTFSSPEDLMARLYWPSCCNRVTHVVLLLCPFVKWAFSSELHLLRLCLESIFHQMKTIFFSFYKLKTEATWRLEKTTPKKKSTHTRTSGKDRSVTNDFSFLRGDALGGSWHFKRQEEINPLRPPSPMKAPFGEEVGGCCFVWLPGSWCARCAVGLRSFRWGSRCPWWAGWRTGWPSGQTGESHMQQKSATWSSHSMLPGVV